MSCRYRDEDRALTSFTRTFESLVVPWPKLLAVRDMSGTSFNIIPDDAPFLLRFDSIETAKENSSINVLSRNVPKLNLNSFWILGSFSISAMTTLKFRFRIHHCSFGEFTQGNIRTEFPKLLSQYTLLTKTIRIEV